MRSSVRLLSAASAVTVSALLAACGAPAPYANNFQQSPPPYSSYPAAPAQPVAAVEYGRITNVSMVSAGNAPAPNRNVAGGVLGAIVGGLLGNQIGHGGGRGAATVLGAAGGAVVGSNIGASREQNVSYPVYRVTVQTDQGFLRTYDVNATGDLRIGDRVRIENGVIYLA
ncbi:MAG TPA: glycine zipper 2TM domain-containing protein [Ramlibacter sp.]|nr:glycine zipper 2TM domain-containing protein [Ramlibacter sp.]